MLKPGTRAPLFQAVSTSGQGISLLGLRKKRVILYFFHKAFTPNCTIETRGFRDNYGEIKEHGVEVVGISTDKPETQCRFASTHLVTFPMLSDADGSIARTYDVVAPLPFLKLARRVTYAIDERGTIAATFNHEFQANKHLDEVLGFIRKWPTEPPFGA